MENVARLLWKTKKQQQQQDIMLTNKNINTLVFCLKWNYMRENQPWLTLAAAYIRHKMNHWNVYGSHKMQIAWKNGLGLSFRPDWSNDDIVCFGTLQNLQQWLERAKKRNNWLWSGQLRKPPQNVRQWSIKWFERDVLAIDEVEFRLNSPLSCTASLHIPATAECNSWLWRSGI